MRAIEATMTDFPALPAEILQQLEGVQELSPADELAAYEQVLADLTELLNAPEERGSGDT